MEPFQVTIESPVKDEAHRRILHEWFAKGCLVIGAIADEEHQEYVNNDEVTPICKRAMRVISEFADVLQAEMNAEKDRKIKAESESEDSGNQ